MSERIKIMNPIFLSVVSMPKIFLATCQTLLVSCSLVYKVNASLLPSINIENSQEIPSIKAVLRTHLSDSDQIIEYWVSLSPGGIFVTNGEFELIKNFKAQRIWLMDLTRKIKHGIDLVEYSKINPDSAAQLAGPAAQNNIMGVAPCFSWNKEYAGTRVWRGKVVESWHCYEDSHIRINTQYFDKKLGLVVRIEHPQSRVDELINITTQAFDEQVFLPKANLTETSLYEFSSGVPSLSQFANKEE